MVILENLKLKPRYCTLAQLTEYCHSFMDCESGCVFGKWSKEFCPVNAFNNYLDQTGLEEELIPIEK